MIKDLDPVYASNTLVRYILYLNIFLLIYGIFKPYGQTGIFAILILNILLLLLSQGMVKDSDRIKDRWGKRTNG